MAAYVVNGDRWIAQRLAHLQNLLKSDLPEDQRTAVVEEIEALSKERGIVLGGLRLPRWLCHWRMTHNGTSALCRRGA